MREEQRHIVEEIVERDGDCFHWSMCGNCPFNKVCLFDNAIQSKSMLTKQQRVKLALDTLARLDIFGDMYEAT